VFYFNIFSFFLKAVIGRFGVFVFFVCFSCALPGSDGMGPQGRLLGDEVGGDHQTVIERR